MWGLLVGTVVGDLEPVGDVGRVGAELVSDRAQLAGGGIAVGLNEDGATKDVVAGPFPEPDVDGELWAVLCSVSVTQVSGAISRRSWLWWVVASMRLEAQRLRCGSG